MGGEFLGCGVYTGGIIVYLVLWEAYEYSYDGFVSVGLGILRVVRPREGVVGEVLRLLVRFGYG